MRNSTKLFIRALESKDIKYTLKKEGEGDNGDVLSCSFSANKMQSIRVSIFVYDNVITFKVFSIAKVPADKRDLMLRKINDLHTEWKWITLGIDEDEEIFARMDVSVCEADMQICVKTLYRIVDITDDCYPDIMKVLWS